MPEDRSVTLKVTVHTPPARTFVLMLHADHETFTTDPPIEYCPRCRTPWPCLAYKVAVEDEAEINHLEAALAMARQSQERWQRDYLETMRLLSECKKPPVDLHRNPSGSGWLPS